MLMKEGHQPTSYLTSYLLIALTMLDYHIHLDPMLSTLHGKKNQGEKKHALQQSAKLHHINERISTDASVGAVASTCVSPTSPFEYSRL